MDKLLELEAAALLEQPHTAGEWFALIDKIKSETYKPPEIRNASLMTKEEVYKEAMKVWDGIMDGK